MSSIYGLGLGFFVGLLVVAVIIFIITMLVFYIYSSIGLFVLGKRLKIEYRWMAFIPILSSFLLGGIADVMNWHIKKKTIYRWLLFSNVLAILCVEFIVAILKSSNNPVALLIAGLPMSFILSISNCVFINMAFYDIAKQFSGKSTAAGLVVANIFTINIVMIFYIFAKRNKQVFEYNTTTGMAYGQFQPNYYAQGGVNGGFQTQPNYYAQGGVNGGFQTQPNYYAQGGVNGGFQTQPNYYAQGGVNGGFQTQPNYYAQGGVDEGFQIQPEYKEQNTQQSDNYTEQELENDDCLKLNHDTPEENLGYSDNDTAVNEVDNQDAFDDIDSDIDSDID